MKSLGPIPQRCSITSALPSQAVIDLLDPGNQAKPCRQLREVVAGDVQLLEIDQSREGSRQRTDLIPLDFQGMQVPELTHRLRQGLQVLVREPQDLDLIRLAEGILQIGKDPRALRLRRHSDLGQKQNHPASRNPANGDEAMHKHCGNWYSLIVCIT